MLLSKDQFDGLIAHINLTIKAHLASDRDCADQMFLFESHSDLEELLTGVKIPLQYYSREFGAKRQPGEKS